MNILYFTTFKVSPTKGGTERTTISVATGLKEIYGFHCYSAYIVDADTPKENCFDAEYCVDGKKMMDDFRKIIIDNDIDFVIDQGDFGLVKRLKEVTSDLKCKIIIAHHFQPGWETHFMTFDGFVDDWRRSTDFLQWCKRTIKLLLYPILRIKFLNKLPTSYYEAYTYADAVVLLSKGFIPSFMKYGHIEDSRKFYIIPNSLSFHTFISDEMVQAKKNIALIVSRLDDPPKRLSLAIRIWGAVKKHRESEGWKLNIVGHGPYLHTYQKMIARLGIPDIYLLGRQTPDKYYEESSIFLMTSKSEGWGLTITEAQQMGVVPIAFNSYESLCDIINNNENGIVIPECDVRQYEDKLLWLMSHTAERRKLAEQAIESSHRYENDKVVALWNTLFKNLKVDNNISCITIKANTPPRLKVEFLLSA